jgi:hypothetical protein
MKVKLKVPQQRNPYVALALKRKAGCHRKTNKALRKAEKNKGNDYSSSLYKSIL